MKKYKVIQCFGLEYTHATVFFNVNTKWNYVGERGEYVRLERQSVFIDVTKEQLNNCFKEIKIE